MKNIQAYFIIALAALFISSCQKGTDDTPKKGDVYLEFFNVVGGSKLNLSTQWYKNENGDSFTVSKLNYYISNVVLKGKDGTTDYVQPESYHLIEHSATASEMAFSIDSLPTGKYSGITFTIGVDSLRNVSGAQAGALDPALGNFWSWNSGYIMLKFEGNSPKSTATDNKLLFHVGGFSGQYNVLKTETLQFPNDIVVTETMTPHVHLQADVLEMFKAPNVIDFATLNTIHMPGANAKTLADNYADMFTITYAGY